MKFKESFIEKVRSSNNVVDIISQYTELKNQNGRFFGLCPYPDHNEKTPSFSVNGDRQFYHCFGCKKSGDIFTFVIDFMGMNFPEAVTYLADRASLAITDADVEEKSFTSFVKKDFNKKRSLLKTNEKVCDYFYKNINTSQNPFRNYCKQRQLKMETLETFKIGGALNSWNSLVDYFEKKEDSLKNLETLGLIKKKKQEGYYDVFRDRLMFPIRSHSGEVVGFGGRLLKKGEPKYLNSSESDIFQKGKTLYGLFETSSIIRSKDEVFIVEGYMDLVRVYEAGVQNVAAVLGTAFTLDHIRLLKRFTKNVTFLFDGDQAGFEALKRVFQLSYKEGLRPKTVSFKQGEDPDDLITKKGASFFRKFINDNKEDLFSFFLSHWFEGFQGSSLDKIAILDKAKSVLNVIEEPALRDLYIQELAQRLRVEPQWVKQHLKKPSALSQKVKHAQKENPSQVKKIVLDFKSCPKPEAYILNLALKKESFLKEVLKGDFLEGLSNPGVKNCFKFIKEKYQDSKSVSFDGLLFLLMKEIEPSAFLVKYAEEEFISHFDKKQLSAFFKDCMVKVEKNRKKQSNINTLEDLKNFVKETKGLSL